jgi:hypothetical protein
LSNRGALPLQALAHARIRAGRDDARHAHLDDDAGADVALTALYLLFFLTPLVGLLFVELANLGREFVIRIRREFGEYCRQEE